MALIPAVAWGSVGLVSGILGGDEHQQTLGMTWGAFFFSIIVTIAFWGQIAPNESALAWGAGIASGLFWSLGQHQQFRSMKAIGISKTMPLSTGLQLIFNAVAGVVLFHEWSKGNELAMGCLALLVLIVGVLLNSIKDSKNSPIAAKAENWGVGIQALILSTIGYGGYTVIVNWANVDSKTMVLPQAIGMCVGAFAMAWGKPVFEKSAYKNIITGLVWGTGNLFMFLSISSLGLAVSYSFSQMGLIISTFGSIFILGEHKTKRELVFITLGSLLVILGGIMMGNI